MIDTIVIKVWYPYFKFLNVSLFNRPLIINDQLISRNPITEIKKYEKYVYNPTKKEKELHNGLPNLTVYERFFQDNGRTYEMHIKFSIPKFLFQSSIKEVGNDNFGQIIGLVKLKLQKMGIETTEEALRKAIVSSAHFCKNIELIKPKTVLDAIQELHRSDLGKGKGKKWRDYDGDGQSLYFHTSSANIIFYDKIKEVLAPQTKGADKEDRMETERQILSSLNKAELPEILRFEVRFGKQQSLDAFLSKVLGRKIKGITFEEIFDVGLSKKILLKIWDEITDRPVNQLALKMEQSIEEVFDIMLSGVMSGEKKKPHSLNKLLINIALYVLINKYGAGSLRNKIEKNWDEKSWDRLLKKVKESSEFMKSVPSSQIITEIQMVLDKFEKYDWQPDTHF